MDRPKEAIERMRAWNSGSGWGNHDADSDAILAYIDWLEGKHVCEWPKELTRERLEQLSQWSGVRGTSAGDAFAALAAIAPVRKKRMVNLWRNPEGTLEISDPEWLPYADQIAGWRKVGGPVEVSE